MFAWNGKHYMMEGIGCGFWANGSQIVPGARMDPAFANHSYVRIREVGSGRVVVNIPETQALLQRHVDEHAVGSSQRHDYCNSLP